MDKQRYFLRTPPPHGNGDWKITSHRLGCCADGGQRSPGSEASARDTSILQTQLADKRQREQNTYMLFGGRGIFLNPALFPCPVFLFPAASLASSLPLPFFYPNTFLASSLTPFPLWVHPHSSLPLPQSHYLLPQPYPSLPCP